LNRHKIVTAAALVAVAAAHYSTVPQTLWEYDECLYAAAVQKFEPLIHHPPPPGSPVYIAVTKLAALFTGDPFRALLAVSIVSVVVGFLAFVLAFSALAARGGSQVAAGREDVVESRFPVNVTGIVAATLLYMSPAVLMSGVLPQADSGALALLGLAIWACARGNPLLLALACAATVGWRPQFSIAVVPMFFVAVAQLRTWRDRVNALVLFGAGCLAWLAPLVITTGGTEGFWNWLSGQAAYFAQHDADLSRSGYTNAQLALRFIAHPWGPKWLALPLLALALAGIRRNRRLLPLAVGALAYLAFALATMDPADAVRYAIPSLPLMAFLAAVTLAAIPFELVTAVAVAGYAAGSYLYAVPVLRTRATTASPPVQAAQWIEKNVPRNTVVLYDLPLRPHAEYLLPGWKTMRIDAGLAQYGGDPSTPMVLLADGEVGDRDGIAFRWPDTDAYRKLTRQHYGSVSVITFPPTRRIRVVEGVYGPERTRAGKAWRWLAARAVVELAPLGATQARISFHATPEYPFAQNRIHIRVGSYETVATIRRNSDTAVVVPLPPGTPRITFLPEQSFVPARIPGANNRDVRTLSVMLSRIEQLDPR
jgi:hypothetical protein